MFSIMARAGFSLNLLNLAANSTRTGGTRQGANAPGPVVAAQLAQAYLNPRRELLQAVGLLEAGQLECDEGGSGRISASLVMVQEGDVQHGADDGQPI
jgi:hypothetical protein